MHESTPEITIVGATGIVGKEALNILAQRGHPPESLRCFGSERSVGQTLQYGSSKLKVLGLRELRSAPIDYALLCADAETAFRVREELGNTPTVIIDNSSAFRMDPGVPLVIPEINGDLINAETRTIANPNCSTVMLLSAVEPLRRRFGVRSITVTTYQAVSGAGRSGIEELYTQTRAHLDHETRPPNVFPHSCAFNVFEHESPLDPDTGFNGEETKICNETRRIWDSPDLPVLPTCVRVPVERTHSQSIILELDASTTVDDVRQQFIQSGTNVLGPGESLTPHHAAGTDEIVIGRIRIDPSSDGRRVLLWVCCDQIRKGAALNAIQIMDTVEQRFPVAVCI